MEQQRALNALEPYIALSKSASSPRAAADLVTQATSAPQTFVFAELLQTPNIQALRNSPDHLPYLRLLEIFSWGSYADYKATPNLPELNQQQHEKLLLLSLLPLCSTPQTLTYPSLQQALALAAPSSAETNDYRALEALITTAIYSNLITAHLDPLNSTVRVTSVAPLRDPAPNSIPTLLSTLSDWDLKCQSTLADIEAQILRVKADSQMAHLKEARRAEAFEAALAQLDKADEEASPYGAATMDNTGSRGKGRPGGGGRFSGLLGKGGKRAAPMDNAGVGAGVSGSTGRDPMDVDDEQALGGKGVPRAAKRKGLGMR